jgi:phage FluMu protein Com
MYKEVFELAESKGYKPFKCAFCGEILINQTYESKCPSCVIQHEIYPAMRTEWNSDYPEDELRLYLLQKWLRDTHKIAVFVNRSTYGLYGYIVYPNIEKSSAFETKSSFSTNWNNYEEALLNGVKEALQLI